MQRKSVRTKPLIKSIFHPNFENRLDARIPFQQLQPEAMACIVDKSMKEIETQLAERDVVIKLEEDARAYLAEKGYDPDMGARPLADGRRTQKAINQ